MKESQDHEVGMAMGQLEAMFKAIQELEGKIAKDGFKERDLPGWIQSHITSAYEYIKQANDNFHELGENVTPAAIGGMGPVQLPGNGTIGSGDFPAGQGDAKQEYKKKRKKMKHLQKFESFINEKLNESHFKTGDKVICIKSGMTGEVIGSEGEGSSEIYMVKREDGEHMEYSPDELKLVESKANEEYIELPSLDVPATELIDAFRQWYRDTADNWEDFKEDMAEDSVDEAAKNAQMEILAYLSNEMNAIIKDRKFKVRADFK